MSQTRTVTHTKPKQKRKNKAKASSTEDEDDAILHSFNQCHYPHCASSSSVMLVQCQYCFTNYCFQHQLPEIHGCGQKVRDVAREHRFDDPKPKSMDADKRALLHSKLQARIRDQQQYRSKAKKNL